MASFNSCSFIYVLFIFSLLFSDIVVQDSDDDYLTDIKIKANYQRDTIPDNKLSNAKAWFDPYEISFENIENHEELEISATQKPDLNSYPPILTEDEQPVFSNVRGEIIENPFPKSRRTTSNDLKTEGFFSAGRQQLCVLDSIYISRWLKELVLKIETESELEPTAVSFQMDSIMLNTLKELSTAKSLEITQLDSLIVNMISQTVITRKEVHDWTIFRGYCFDIAWVAVYVTSLCFIAYVFHCFFKHHPKLMLLFCVVFIGVIWNWRNLYKQIKIYKHAELTSINIPDQCKKHDLDFKEYVRDYIKSYFINNECDVYYETLPVDPLWEMSFVAAASEVIHVFLFHPISTLSQYIDCTLKQNFDDLSVNIYIILILFALLLIVLIRNYRQCRKGFLPEPLSTVRNYVGKVYSSVTGLLRNKRSKNSTGIKRSRAKGTVELDSDDDDSHSVGDEGNSNHRRLPSDAASRPVDFRNSGLRCEGCHNLEPTDDDESGSYSDDSSGSINSVDSQDCCPCCVVSEELLQELHVGCRDCENKNRINAGAGPSRDNTEDASKSVSDDESDLQNAHAIDDSMPTRERNYGHDLDRENNSHANDNEGSPRYRVVDPLAG